jgi:hypothetical protein
MHRKCCCGFDCFGCDLSDADEFEVDLSGFGIYTLVNTTWLPPSNPDLCIWSYVDEPPQPPPYACGHLRRVTVAFESIGWTLTLTIAGTPGTTSGYKAVFVPAGCGFGNTVVVDRGALGSPTTTGCSKVEDATHSAVVTRL